jgi:precorrin-6B methylase 2
MVKSHYCDKFIKIGQIMPFLVLAVFLMVLFIWKIYKKNETKIKFWLWLRKNHYQHVHVIYKTLYQHINGFALSKQDRQKNYTDSYEMTYGEITFYSLATLLKQINIPEHGVFYDLGSGTGKAVIIAALLYPFKELYGVEKLPSLHHQAEKQAQLLQQQTKRPAHCQSQQIQFLNEDLFATDISNADVIYVNATAFFGERKYKLIKKLQEIKTGGYVLINSKPLPQESFTLIAEPFLPMSWGGCCIYIHQKK